MVQLAILNIFALSGVDRGGLQQYLRAMSVETLTAARSLGSAADKCPSYKAHTSLLIVLTTYNIITVQQAIKCYSCCTSWQSELPSQMVPRKRRALARRNHQSALRAIVHRRKIAGGQGQPRDG